MDEKTQLLMDTRVMFKVKCVLPTDPAFLIPSLSNIRAIQIYVQDYEDHQILITEYTNPIGGEYREVVLKLVENTNSIVVRGLAESVRGITILSGDVTVSNSKCKFIPRDVHNPIVLTSPILTSDDTFE